MDEVEMQNLVKRGWIKAEMIFDTQALDKKVLQELLKRHADKLKMEPGVKVYEANFTEIDEVEPVPQFKAQGIKKVYSQLLEVVFMAQNFEVMANVTMAFGPTAVEILEPDKITIDMRTMQNVLASISELMHKYAAAGRGGVMITQV